MSTKVGTPWPKLTDETQIKVSTRAVERERRRNMGFNQESLNLSRSQQCVT